MDIIGLLLSYFLLFIMFLLSVLLPKLHISTQTTRKIIHIGISNWWVIAMLFFTNRYIALIPPISFLLLNYLSYHFNLVKGIEREDRSELGTIYYPISLIILVYFFFIVIYEPYIGAIGVLLMGYGDGLATIIGSKIKSKKIFKNKTYMGSFTMFIVSLITLLIILFTYHPTNLIIYSLIISFIATISELFSEKGIDNLTVPLSSSFLYYILITLF